MPKPPRLSSEFIAATAAELITRKGAEALSSRRLAAKLRCSAMSLYHHVRNMDEVLDLVVDHTFRTVPLPELDRRKPRKQLDELLQAYLKLAVARPRIFRVVGTRRWRTPAAVEFQSRIYELLILIGLKRGEALRAARVLIVYLNGGGLAIAGWKLNRAKVDLPTNSKLIKSLLKLALVRPIALDVEWGLQVLLRNLVP
jgi:AcrR family transcriptional regulator